MIRGDLRDLRPFVTGTVILPRLGIHTPVDFLVDTGSNLTVIHPLDSSRLQVNFARDLDGAAVRTATGIGGTAQEYVESCELEFEHVDGSTDAIELEVAFAMPSEHNLRYPALLGLNVIGLYKLTYHLAENLVSLE